MSWRKLPGSALFWNALGIGLVLVGFATWLGRGGEEPMPYLGLRVAGFGLAVVGAATLRFPHRTVAKSLKITSVPQAMLVGAVMLLGGLAFLVAPSVVLETAEDDGGVSEEFCETYPEHPQCRSDEYPRHDPVLSATQEVVPGALEEFGGYSSAGPVSMGARMVLPHSVQEPS